MGGRPQTHISKNSLKRGLCLRLDENNYSLQYLLHEHYIIIIEKYKDILKYAEGTMMGKISSYYLPYCNLVIEIIWSITTWINQRSRLKLVCSAEKAYL